MHACSSRRHICGSNIAEHIQLFSISRFKYPFYSSHKGLPIGNPEYVLLSRIYTHTHMHILLTTLIYTNMCREAHVFITADVEEALRSHMFDVLQCRINLYKPQICSVVIGMPPQHRVWNFLCIIKQHLPIPLRAYRL